MESIYAAVNGPKGYYFGFQTDNEDLDRLRKTIKTHFLRNIAKDFPKLLNVAAKVSMDQYHQFCETIPHETYWTKTKRILPKDLLREFKDTRLYRWLHEHCEIATITGEDLVEEEEVYWRLVRPNAARDVGSLHADAWFWELAGENTPDNVERVKVWIPIFTEPGISGLKYIPGSQQESIPYSSVTKNGKKKPIIQVDLDHRSEVFNGSPGTPFIFNDRLIHGGNVGGERTRVSVEFTFYRLCNPKHQMKWLSDQSQKW